MSITVFTSLLLVLHNKLLLTSKLFDLLVILTNIFSIALYVGYIQYTDDQYAAVKHHFTFYLLFTSPQFYLVVLLASGACFMVDFAIEMVGQLLMSDTRNLVHGYAVDGKVLDEDF